MEYLGLQRHHLADSNQITLVLKWRPRVEKLRLYRPNNGSEYSCFDRRKKYAFKKMVVLAVVL